MARGFLFSFFHILPDELFNIALFVLLALYVCNYVLVGFIVEAKFYLSNVFTLILLDCFNV